MFWKQWAVPGGTNTFEMNVSGKSSMGVHALAAAKGSTITVSCDGEDAEHAMTALAKVIENGLGEP